MTEPSSHRSDRKSLTVAIIGAAATLGAAVIGLVAAWIGSKPEPNRPVLVLPSFVRAKDEGPARQGPVAPPTQSLVATDHRPNLTLPPDSGRSPKAGPALRRPPVEVTYRPSQIPGQGMVAGIRNTTDKETLKNLVVFVRSPGDRGERSHRVRRSLRPNETASVGWRELDNWKLKPGDLLRVEADRYPAPFESVVPRK